jgi:hypothetical protein
VADLIGQAEEIAATAAWLLSNEASFITGSSSAWTADGWQAGLEAAVAAKWGSGPRFVVQLTPPSVSWRS